MSVLVGIALVSGACSDSGDAPTEPVTRQAEAIELAVRVHLVQSDQLDALNVRLSETEVAQLMTAVNETWAQAGIVWSVESIVREDARNEFLFLRALTDPTVSPISVLTSVLTSENLGPDIWNVFMIRDFGGGVGGVYLGIEGVVVSRRSIPGDSVTLTEAWRASLPMSSVTPWAWFTCRAWPKATSWRLDAPWAHVRSSTRPRSRVFGGRRRREDRSRSGAYPSPDPALRASHQVSTTNE